MLPLLKPRTLLFVIFIIFSVQLSAQHETNAIPAVTVADFSPVSTQVNSETDAVILLDSGSSTVDANPQDGFFVNYYLFRRVLIRNKRSLDEVSTVSIPFSAELNGKKLKKVNAYTYNLENGKISKVAIQDKDLYVEESNNVFRREKFAFPNARDGSIIEFEFSVKLDTYNLVDWYFQSGYRKVKSIYSVQVPDGFNYSIQFQGKKYLTGTVAKKFVKTLYAWTNFDNTTINDISWTYENVPPMREEIFTSTIENYIGCVKFQPSAIPTQPGVSKGVLNDWSWYAKLLLQSDAFGKPIADPSTMIRKQAKIFAGESNTELQKAMGIYANVRDHFTVTGNGRFIRDNKNLSDIYKAGIGNVAEINLVLIAMLRSEKVQADPVILATRANGLTNQKYPVLDNYNYLVCRIVVNNKEYFLDASSPYMAFGKLPVKCYNGHARVITKETFPVFLAPDSLKESRAVVANIYNTGNSKNMCLEWTNRTGFYESCDLRKELKDKKQEAIFKSMTEAVPFKKSLDSFFIADLKNMDNPLVAYYKMSLDFGGDPRIYFNPLLNSGLTENPFKAAVRSYPVEMPFVSDNSFELNMEIPTGYEAEELPKSEKIMLNELDGSFEYRVETNGNKIQIKSITILNKAIFEPEDYDKLKDFYTTIIRKQNEMIVFKKKG